MTTGTWEPQSEAGNNNSYTLELSFLTRLINEVSTFESTNTIDTIEANTLLSNEERQSHKKIMTLPKENWFAISDELSENDIILLIKFFTLAEKQINDWIAEEKSPVIWLSKMLRKKGSTLDKNLLLWIKSNSNNKFLPYGPL